MFTSESYKTMKDACPLSNCDGDVVLYFATLKYHCQKCGITFYKEPDDVIYCGVDTSKAPPPLTITEVFQFLDNMSRETITEFLSRRTRVFTKSILFNPNN